MKIGIVGAGFVGSTTAYALVMKRVASFFRETYFRGNTEFRDCLFDKMVRKGIRRGEWRICQKG